MGQNVLGFPCETVWNNGALSPLTRHRTCLYCARCIARADALKSPVQSSCGRGDHAVAVARAFEVWDSSVAGALAPQSSNPDRIVLVRNSCIARADAQTLICAVRSRYHSCSCCSATSARVHCAAPP